MAEPFMGELRLFSFAFAPKGWALCNGQVMPINQNQALFSLLGTMYGGDGRVTFALPDLRGRIPRHVGANLSVQGQQAGEEQHTLTIAEAPAHTHTLQASSLTGTLAVPGGNLLAAANDVYRLPTDLVAVEPGSVSSVGGGSSHENRQPYSVLSWCIALNGIFPSES